MCRKDGAENASAFAQMAREQRAARRGVSVEELDNRDRPGESQGELPEGF